MGTEITRKNISAISKLMADPELSKISYLQRIDRLAEVLGFENQAALMATLKASETTPVVQETAEGHATFRTVMVFGSEYTRAVDGNERISQDNFGEVKVLSFSSKEAVEAYHQGVGDGEGWERYMSLGMSGPGFPARERSFLAAVEEDPDLDFAAWQDAYVDELEEEFDDEPD